MGIFGIAKKGFGMLGKKAKVSPTITGVKPKSKIKGSKSVGEVKTKAGISKMKAAGFNLGQTMKKTGENIDKLNTTVEKNIKILREKKMFGGLMGKKKKKEQKEDEKRKKPQDLIYKPNKMKRLKELKEMLK